MTLTSHSKLYKPPTVIAPELFRREGGVQTFSRRLIAALDELYTQPVPLISRNDRSEDLSSEFRSGREIVSCGAYPISLRRFAVAAACISSDAPFFIATHFHFARWLAIQSLFRKRRLLTIVHGIEVWNLKKRADFGALQRSDRILAVSKFTKQSIENQLGKSAPPIDVFPNTFEEERYFPAEPIKRWRDQLDIPADAIVVLTVCRITPAEREKGYDHVLECLPALRKQYPSIVWILGGQGGDLSRVQDRAIELGVAEACRFPGFIPDEDLPDLYRSADLFILPSKKEGFGIVFLEAAACGLPVIAGNRDGSPEALALGALGQLIDPDSHDELIAAVNVALTSPRKPANELHRQCVEAFGREAFEGRLRRILEDFSPQPVPQ